ncbi:MAG: bifunctional folylpolyglutamate synthase/dihydrofolate synthase [Bryobacteraceae bacterium]|nr:bifunctional folylpolyglutamate synthase/dihydrofolate synthase [Bryobacteraceae bacterium]
MSNAYPDSVQFLYALGNEYKTLKLGLDRVQALLDRLGSPHRDCRFIHVAGTNGKGSTCAMLESALREAGVRTGLFSSPHLVEPTERIRVAGAQVSRQDFAAAFDEVHRTALAMIRKGELDGHPTYFESIAAMAFLLFRQHAVGIAVLETGMGGRLDATNVVDPLLAVLTPVDFDHEKFLGSTIPQIAFEKAGILKPGRPAVVAIQRPEALAVIEQRARETGSPLTHASSWRAEDLHQHAYGNSFTATFRDYATPVELPLIGAHQVDNALTAVAALVHLGIAPEHISNGLARVQWPGRLECVRRDPDVFLDGAHNPSGAAALARYIREFHTNRAGGGRVWMLFGAMNDKDLKVLAPLLFPLAHELVFTTPNQTRAYPAEAIREITGETRARLIASPSEALERILAEARPQDAVFITGSLYLVGEVRPLLVP